MDKITRLKYLTKTLNIARFNYYNENETMDNYQYDTLYDELLALEKETGVILNNSPTQSVGYTVLDSLEKVGHKTPLLSLDKTKQVKDLYKFIGNQPCLLMYKGDGCTTELTYENGELILAATRGNGHIGEVITSNAKTFVNVPKTIPYKGRLRVVGESMIDYPTFKGINEVSETQYKNPRNLVSGTIRQLNPEICASRKVIFKVFGINEGFEDVDSKHETFHKIKDLGFDIMDWWCALTSDKNLEDIIEHIENNMPEYPIDGLVVTYDSKSYSESLGVTSHHPRHSIAFKWADQPEYTTLRDVQVDIGRSGRVSYTAIFDEVEIDGTSVSRATLHNYDYIKNLQLGIGDMIGVVKANLIIPAVVENETRSDSYLKATHCPYCGTELIQDGAHQFCSNIQCDRRVLLKLSHFVSRDAMNIDGISEETISSIMEIKNDKGKSILNEVWDLYSIIDNAEVLLTLDGFGKKKVDKIVKELEKSKDKPLRNVLYGLGINQFGKTATEKLANKYHNMDDVIDALKNDIRTVRRLLGESITNGLVENLDYIIEANERLKAYGLKMEQEVKSVSSDKLNGLNFVITGDVIHYKNRNELKDAIVAQGGKVQSGVSKTTNYLINNDVDSSTGKNAKAKELGIKIISENEFLELIK